jgi:hypothetical protein
MTATPIEQLKREAFAGLGRLGVTLDNMPPIDVDAHAEMLAALKLAQPWLRYLQINAGSLSAVWDAVEAVDAAIARAEAACAAVEGRTI